MLTIFTPFFTISQTSTLFKFSDSLPNNRDYTISESQHSAVSALATPSRTQRRMDPRRRRLKLFRKKTFLVNDPPNNNKSNETEDTEDKTKKLRIVQFSEETALSKSIRRKAPTAKLDGKKLFRELQNVYIGYEIISMNFFGLLYIVNFRFFYFQI